MIIFSSSDRKSAAAARPGKTQTSSRSRQEDERFRAHRRGLHMLALSGVLAGVLGSLAVMSLIAMAGGTNLIQFGYIALVCLMAALFMVHGIVAGIADNMRDFRHRDTWSRTQGEELARAADHCWDLSTQNDIFRAQLGEEIKTSNILPWRPVK